MKVSEVLQLDTIVDILMLALAETPPPHLAVRSLGRSACVCVAWRRGNADNYPWRAVALNFNSPTLRRFLDGISREDCGTDLEQPGLWQAVVRSGCKRPINIRVSLSGVAALVEALVQGLNLGGKSFLSLSNQTAYEVTIVNPPIGDRAPVLASDPNEVIFALMGATHTSICEKMDCSAYLDNCNNNPELIRVAAGKLHRLVALADEESDKQIEIEMMKHASNRLWPF